MKRLPGRAAPVPVLPGVPVASGLAGVAGAFAISIIFANYAAQIPYSIHLYGTHASARGGLALAVTLAWFLVGLALLRRRSVVGHWLTVSFLLADAGFYTLNVIGSTVHGYGPFFQLWTERDPILWTVFAIGYLNLLAAGYLLIRLLRRWPAPGSAHRQRS